MSPMQFRMPVSVNPHVVQLHVMRPGLFGISLDSVARKLSRRYNFIRERDPL